VRTEEVGAVILNQLQSAGGDYADTHARYDYLTVNHFADITDGSGTEGVTVSNPDLAFARLGHSTATHLDTTTPQLHLLAGGQVDGPNLGIRGQNGNTRFLQRFALRPHGGYHPAAAMKFALEHQNPFVTGAINGKDSVHPENTHSLLKVSNPDVLLWALKPHEDGIEHGLVARLWNLSDQPAEADITFAGGISVAHRMTHIETDVEAVPLTAAGTLPATFTRQQIQTYRFKTR
jgi:alpha-mannosidase